MPRPVRKTNDPPEAGEVRIVGGRFRGRKLPYTGDLRTRPMKDRVREAIFNLLGPSVRGAWAIDLFAGTGALGMEALSRGAVRATFIERHIPTAKAISENLKALGAASEAEVFSADTFYWVRKFAPMAELAMPWTIFCSPPYALYSERQGDMLALIRRMMELAPAGSHFVVESDATFDVALLPEELEWDVRSYPPAVVALAMKATPPPTAASSES